jgi:hypothetical protein
MDRAIAEARNQTAELRKLAGPSEMVPARHFRRPEHLEGAETLRGIILGVLLSSGLWAIIWWVVLR